MSISICTFEIAMKKIGVRRVSHLLNKHGKCSISVGNVGFIYSGFGEVIFEGSKISTEIRRELVKELKGEYVGAFDFENNRIYTLRGLLTLMTKISGIYSKEFVDQIINDTYKELLQNELIQSKTVSIINGMHSEKMLRLYELLKSFDNVVNPFADSATVIKEPIEYLSFFSMDIIRDPIEKYIKLKLQSKDGKNSMCFEVKNGKYSYNFRNEIMDKTSGNGRIITFTHSYEINSSKEIHNEKVIFYDYMTSMKSQLGGKCVDSLNLCMQTGMAWKSNDNQKAKIVTEKQLEHAILHVSNCINIARDVFISKMIA